MQDFLNFKTLITEKVLKWIYLVLVAISAIATAFIILASWVMAFRMLSDGFGQFILYLILVPVVIVLVVALYMVILRIAFEATLVRFLIYRETKELNEKIGR